MPIYSSVMQLAGSPAYADSVPPQAAPTNTTVAKPKPSVSQYEGCQLADSQAGPAMVAIRPAYFQMGSPNNEASRADDEGPQHQVTIPRPFALSRCEITVGQFMINGVYDQWGHMINGVKL